MDLKMYSSLPSKKKHESEYKNSSFRSGKQQSNLSLVNQVYLNGRLIMAHQFHEDDGSMATLMQILVFCNDNINRDKFDGNSDLEKALLDFAATKGFHKKLFDKIIPKIAEVRVDGNPGAVSAIIGLNGQYRLAIKDKPENLLSRCDKLLFKGKTVPFTMNMVAKIKNVYQRMAADNLQVIMLAFKDIERLPVELDPVFQVNRLTLVGMIGLHDIIPIADGVIQ
jgi:Ca2+-transporting ATPase